jgi:Flp pilus assembly pilin Flp
LDFLRQSFQWPSAKKATGGSKGRWKMSGYLLKLWYEDGGQDIAEYAVMLAVILVLVVGTIRLIGSNANNAFSATASSIQ